MSNTKHTPGPWEVTFNGVIVSSTSCETVAAPLYGFKPIARMEADAKLIAAAPEMAGALRDCAQFLLAHADMNDLTHPDTRTQKLIAAARAALAKAGL